MGVDVEPPEMTAGSIAFRLGAVIILVLANAFFVAAEFALVSVRQSRLEAAAEDTRSMSADEFDRTLLKVWKNPGK